MKVRNVLAIGALMAGFAAALANADIYITEWMYSGDSGEFVELTNVGSTSVDMTNWSYDDSSATPGSEDLSAFGVVAAGESVILTEATAADFRTAWGLSASVKVIGGIANNLGRGDEINIYDASNALVDRLTYEDNGAAGGPRTQNASGNPLSLGVLGTNDAPQWVLSTVGDSYGSYESSVATSNNIGNPGTFALPEPASLILMAAGGLMMARRRRRA